MLKKKIIPVVWLLIIALASCQSEKETMQYPVCKKVEQVDDYFGTQVADPYRWLEDETTDDTKAWVQAQHDFTENYLNQIPYREKVRARLEELWNYPKEGAPFKEGDRYYLFKNDGLQNQYVLYSKDALDGEEKLFFDPNTLSEDGTASMNTYSFSKDGAYFAYGVSKGGSDWVEFFVMEVATQTLLSDHIQHSKFSNANWYKDGFFYTRYPEPEAGKELSSANENAAVYYHQLGTNQSADKLIYIDKEHPQRGCNISTTDDEQYLLLSIREGASRNNDLYIKEANQENASFMPIATGLQNPFWVVHSQGKAFWIMTNKDAPKYKLMKMNLDRPEMENWEEIIPEGERPIDGITIAKDKLIVSSMKDVCSLLEVYDLEGNKLNEIPLPSPGNATSVKANEEDSIAFISFQSYAYPPSILQYNLDTKKTNEYKKSAVDFPSTDYETKQIFYESKDGTKIPMFITHKKGITLDGNNPTMLYAYGGFNISIQPRFSISNLILLENGGIYAVANIRGGSEYGEEWHQGGMLLNKQNVFDDFITAAEYLIRNKYTSSEKLAINGRSNGGLLVGACMTQRPDLYQVAFPAVGVLDMLRFHKFTIGHAWVPEYGSSEANKEQFENLYAYSPIHNVKEGIAYPATMVITADHDDRVVPAHSFKFIATLQEKQTGSNPTIIRIDTKSGHGAGKPTSKIIEEYADLWAFMFHHVGVEPKY